MSHFPNSQTPNPRSELLISYFRSGWAFLIPYLAAYLLYAWLKWPVNPVNSEGLVKGIREGAGALNSQFLTTQLSTLSSQSSTVPPLLHVYWFLHGLHLLLGGLALRIWWRNPTLSTLNSQPASYAQIAWHRLYAIIPWLCLALIFWIPGIYLEWPSDPWEHLRRINEWHILDEVTAHSSWKKSSYFLPYSLTGLSTGFSQLSLLNYYYVGICLLLTWQYYRLGRAAGLGERPSFIFVLINALTFGNNIFSFYRYYGLSSSIFAQIGAVALTRIALEYFAASVKRRDHATLPETVGTTDDSRGSPAPSFTAFICAGSVLGLFIVFNHIQGLGIAGLGVLAVIIWRLIEWKHAAIYWLVALALGLSAAVVQWIPVDDFYRSRGWLNAWHGFNFFSPASPAFGRALGILGVFGLGNLFLGLWLIVRRNHLAGWLVVMPILALALPCFAVPFVHFVATKTAIENVLIFQRMLLAMPMGLGMVVAFPRLASMQTPVVAGDNEVPQHRATPFLAGELGRARCMTVALAGSILILNTLSPGISGYNRFWHSIQISPDDLQLRHLAAAWNPNAIELAGKETSLVVAAPIQDNIQKAFQPRTELLQFRQIGMPPSFRQIEQRLSWIDAMRSTPAWSEIHAGPHRVGEHSSLKIFSCGESPSHSSRIIADLSASDAEWLLFNGHTAERESAGSRVRLSNPIGSASHIFGAKLIPITSGTRYRITSTVRQNGPPLAVNYLAVAWYGQDRNLLPSNLPKPGGAGDPLGWSNGSYSYFGMVGQPAGSDWTTFKINFGYGEALAIPPNAVFFRVGALLNDNTTPGAKVEITDVIVAEQPGYQHLLFASTEFRYLYTPASQAGRLSGHWPPNQVLMEHAGIRELAVTSTRH